MWNPFGQHTFLVNEGCHHWFYNNSRNVQKSLSGLVEAREDFTLPEREEEK